VTKRQTLHDALCAAPPLYSTEDTPVEGKTIYARVTASWSMCEWLVSEYDPVAGVIFGWCDLGIGFPEWGYATLDEIADLDVEVYPGFPVRAVLDTDFEPVRFSELGRERRSS